MYLPAAIRYGIPYETFWHLNPVKLGIFQDVYNDRVKEQDELLDFTAWRNGMYMVNAIQSALFPKKAKYPEKPYSKMKPAQELSAEEEFKLWIMEYNRRFDEENSTPIE